MVAGLLFHAVFIYGGFVWAIAKLRVRDFWRVIRPAQLIAFSTSSSAAALPVAMEAAKDNMRIPSSTSSFVRHEPPLRFWRRELVRLFRLRKSRFGMEHVIVIVIVVAVLAVRIGFSIWKRRQYGDFWDDDRR